MLGTVDALLETLVDFSDPRAPDSWEAIGDRVMGGQSTGRLETLPGGRAVFLGEISLEDGGGFASVRSGRGSYDLSRHEGLVLEIRGDGRTYKLAIRTDPDFDGVSWQAAFETRPGSWEAIRLPLAGFRPTWRGRPVPGAGRLEPGRVVSFGLVVAERRAGSFRLEISALRAYRAG
jgi:NADH dehydrogenase [ubiquinone] 1 alpha subcomplex assembly factor 1